MSDKPLKRYPFASDFDQTLTFNDSGYVLSELVGIPTAEFERKAKGMANLILFSRAPNLLTCCCTIPSFTGHAARERARWFYHCGVGG
jgi:hypothetical protein